MNRPIPNKPLKHYIVIKNETAAARLQTAPFGKLLRTLNKEQPI